MKFTILGFIFLVSVAATCALFGWLESSLNMIEGLKQLFAPGATTVVFSPILLLFIALCLGVFIGVPLFVVTVVALLGGSLLRSQTLTMSRSFARWFVLFAVIFQFAFMLFAIEQNAWFLRGRPRTHPATPPYVLAFLTSANCALDLFIAALIIRKLLGKVNSSPLL